MESIYKIGSEIGSPLALAGFVCAIFFGITLALVRKLVSVDQQQSAKLVGRVLLSAFILAIFAMLLGVGGWAYAKYVEHDLQKTKRVERLDSIDRFSKLVTVLRTETDRLIDGYPKDYASSLAAGNTDEQAKDTLLGKERRRIDDLCGAYQVGSSVRATFPDFNWDLFFHQGKDHYLSFYNAVHAAAAAKKEAEELTHLRELQKDYMHHLEQRLEELRDKVGLPASAQSPG